MVAPRRPLIIRKRTVPSGSPLRGGVPYTAQTSRYPGRPVNGFGGGDPTGLDPNDPAYNAFWNPHYGPSSGAAPIDPNAAPGMGGIGGNYQDEQGQVRVPVGASLRDAIAAVGTRRQYYPQTGIEENQGDPFALIPETSLDTRTPLDPGFDLPSFVNPYRTVMYSITGLSVSLPSRVIQGNFKRTYLLIQNLGPGNLFLGVGVDPNAGGANVLNLVQTQVYEQIGGGFYLPPNPWYPYGVAFAQSFVSPEYISLLSDIAGTAAMILEGTFAPPRAGQANPGS